MTLRFGKHKGQQFENTPKNYQDWLLKQNWFKTQKPLHQQLMGWDGYSKKGEAVYNSIFEQEKKMSEKEDCRQGICYCCEYSKYYGI
jgi:hypothetical protein